MGQDRESGARANSFGREMGRLIAKHMDFDIASNSNEGVYNGEQVVIKSVSYTNPKFGIVKGMIERIDKVLLARETEQRGTFELYSIALKDIIEYGSSIKSKDNIVNFSVSKAIEKGIKFGEYYL